MSSDHALRASASRAEADALGRDLPAPSIQARPTVMSRILRAAVRRTLPSLDRGRLTVSLGTSARADVCGALPGPSASISFDGLGGLWRTLRGGKLGFAESYMEEALDIDDLEQLFLLFIDNEETLIEAASPLLRARVRDKVLHAIRGNTRSGSRRNIAAHYDLGNAFYSHWLDEGMSYSSGIYADANATLEQAQDLKHRRILEALAISPGQAVLEIGCGWGSVAERIARVGAEFKGITISREQLDWSRRRLDIAGLSRHAAIEFEDYRDTRGTFDRIVSIEMIEAVGEEHWPAYFDVLARRLKPGGRGVLQAITIPERFFDYYRRSPDFIQRYIFPGGMLPTISAMRGEAHAAGLRFSTVERFAPSYARTLRDWRTRFLEAWPRIEALGFDERFRRMWLYYLSYCAAGFERGTIDVGLYLVEKPET